MRQRRRRRLPAPHAHRAQRLTSDRRPFSGPLSGASLDLQSDNHPSVSHPFDADPRARYGDGGVLGRGGMGEVRAVWDRRLDREVAYKTLLAPSPGAEARLAREVWITARLEHPGIVPVLDAGRGDDGALFYTMRLIRGRSLAEAIKQAEGTPARLRLLRNVLDAAQAVAYAHSQGVVHRDLKPANIMVGAFGETLVVDWGLAGPHDHEALGTPARGWPPLADRPGVVGTPEYMSPQQAAGEAPTPGDDVFSLGGVLFEVLAGVGPHAQGAPRRLLEVAPEAPPEAAAIVDRALSPVPEARYRDAKELVDDLEAMLDGRRVAAYAYSPAELMGRTIRAYRAPLAVAAAAAVLLSVMGVITVLRTTAERNRALVAEADAVAAKTDADTNLARALAARALDAAAQGRRAQAETLAAEALVIDESPDARGVLSMFAAEARPRRLRSAPLPPCTSLRVSPDGATGVCIQSETTLALALDSDQPVLARLDDEVADAMPLRAGLVAITRPPRSFDLWDFEAGSLERIYETKSLTRLSGGLVGDRLLRVGSSPAVAVDLTTGATRKVGVCVEDRRHIWGTTGPHVNAVACVDGIVHLVTFDELLAGERGRELLRGVGSVTSLSFSRPEPTHLVIGTVQGRVLVVDVATGATTRAFDLGADGVLDAVAWGDRVAVSGMRREVQVLSISDGRLLASVPQSGARLAWLGEDTLRVVGRHVEDWHLPTRPDRLRHRFDTGLAAVAVADGMLAVAEGSGRVTVREIASGAPAGSWDFGPGVAKDVAFSPNGRHLSAASVSDYALFAIPDWRTRGPQRLAGSKHRRTLWLDDDTLVGASYRDGPEIWTRGDAWERRPRTELGEIADAERASDGRGGWLLTVDGTLGRLDPDGALEVVAEHPGALAAGGPSDAPVVAFGDGLRLDHAPPLPLADRSRTLDLAVSPDGAYIALGHADGTVTVWSRAERRLLAVLRGHATRVPALAFSEAGDRLVTGSWDATARVWGVDAWTRPAEELRAAVVAAWGLDLERANAR